MKIKTFLFLPFLTLMTVFPSCDLALGDKLHLDPPTTEITSPLFMENVNTSVPIVIKGISRDLQEVVFVNVSIEITKGGQEWKRSWKSERGTWSGDLLESASWNNKGEGVIEWSCEVDMSSAPEGEYVISAGAVNNVDNVGPYAQRRVLIDKTAPVVTINLPELFTNESDLSGFHLENPGVLDKIHSTGIKVQYEVDDDFSIATLRFELYNGGDVFYRKLLDPATWSGTLEISADEIKTSINGDPVGSPITGTRQTMRIRTVATDKSGNTRPETFGWLLWDTRGDIPWSVGAGTENIGGPYPQVFYQSPVFATAYDNQGVKSITYTIARNTSGTTYVETGLTGTVVNNPIQAGSDPSKFFNFTFPPPEDEGRYRVTITTTDIQPVPVTGTDIFYFEVFKPSNLPALLSGLGGIPGTYGQGGRIEIYLNFRQPLSFTDTVPSLSLNLAKAGGGTAVYSSGNGTSQWVFVYEVAAGDNTSGLRINSINLAGSSISPPGGGTIPPPSNILLITEQNLDYYGTNILINTTPPVLETAVYAAPNLTLGFDKRIYKGTGNITLTQQTGYVAPAVLSKNDYHRFGGDARLGTYYECTTNGATSAGEPDTSEKYVLRYKYNTDDDTLVSRLIEADANKVIIPVGSTSVNITGGSSNQLQVNLEETGNFAPRVKGVSYIITYNHGIVEDSQGNKAEQLTGATRTFPYPGVNTPVIRVNKEREQIVNSGTVETFALTPEYRWYARTAVSISQPIGGSWINMGYTQFRNADTTVRIDQTAYNNLTAGERDQYINVNTLKSQLLGSGPNFDNLYIDPFKSTPYYVFNPYWNGVHVRNLWINTAGSSIDAAEKPAGDYYQGPAVSHAITSGTRTAGSVTARQPMTTNFKIDTQTPGTTIRYTVTADATAQNAPFSGPFNGGHAKPSVTMPSDPMPASAAYNAGSPPQLGAAGNLNGYIYGIKARAYPASGDPSAIAYETVTRSVIAFRNLTETQFWTDTHGEGGTALVTNAANAGQKVHLWVRGGDKPTGDNVTPGFPLAWKEENRSGIRLFTSPADASGNNGTWYWVSWEITVPAYFHFIAGTTQTNAAGDAQTNGPLRWTWGRNAWAYERQDFVLQPGGSLIFSRDTVVRTPATMRFSFFRDFDNIR